MSRAEAIGELADRVVTRQPGAVARAISLVEDRRPTSETSIVELLQELRRRASLDACQRVGMTGPPGVGKSTLVSSFARHARRKGRSVGVLAVDPSSPRSGGALLGDRARIDVDPDDTGLYVRSMASGGDLGGLARAAGAAVDVLSAAYELVVIETTGVGQSETDIEHVADSVVMIIQPGSGDVLQFLKAGIIEIPDVFVVNKSDLGEIATRAVAELGAALSAVHTGASGSIPPVVSTSASSGAGVEELLQAVDAHWHVLIDRGRLAEDRARAASQWGLRLLLQRYGEYGVDRAGGKRAVRDALASELTGGVTAVEAVARVAQHCR